MTRNVAAGSESLIFQAKESVAEHILASVLTNKRRLVGTEWEVFCVDQNWEPISRENSALIFSELRQVLAFQGYRADSLHEDTQSHPSNGFGLVVEGLGLIVPEAGLQFEFACSVSENSEEIEEKNEIALSALTEAAKRLNCKLVFKGHLHGYASHTEGSHRNRSAHWHEYYKRRFGSDALIVGEGIDATASTQVTIDSGAEKFHEFFQALLLIEPALTLYYANSLRPYISVQRYGRFIPSQVEPVLGIWHTQNAEEAIIAFVDHLLKLEVPFLPDPGQSGLYKAEPLIDNHPPTVQALMEQGRLSEKILNNVGNFCYSRPAFKNFSEALIEVRGIDSQPTPKKVAEVAHRVVSLVYNDDKREKLLENYSHLTSFDIYKLHHASTLPDKDDAFDTVIANMSMADFVEDILDRSEPKFRLPSIHQGRDFRAIA